MDEETLTSAESRPGAELKGLAPTTPRPEIDLQAYVDDLGDLDVTEAQKMEFLGVLASIMWHFVELGFHVDILDLLVPPEESGAVDSLQEDFDETSPKNGREEGPA